MTHETQIRTVEGSSTVVLLIHGILGTPHQFDPILPAIPQEWSMINLLLDGHGGSVEAFGQSSMHKWETQVADAVNTLCSEYENVFIIAHSMGTLFAIDAALAHPGKVKALTLLSPPLIVGPKRRLIHYTYRIGLGFGGNLDAELSGVRHAYSLKTERRIWKYYRWIPRYLELFSKIQSTRKKLPTLRTPTTVFLCLDDEMVSVRSKKYVENHPACSLIYLPNSTHFTYGGNDADTIRKAILNLNTLI